MTFKDLYRGRLKRRLRLAARCIGVLIHLAFLLWLVWFMVKNVSPE